MCNQLLNRHICMHAIPGPLQPCAIRHLPHPVIPLAVQLTTPCPTCASHTFNPAFVYSRTQPSLLRFQPANIVVQPQQIYLPGSTPMLFQPRLVPPSWAPLAPMHRLQIQPQVVVPMHGYGQPIWTFASVIHPPYYPAYPQPHSNSIPPTQPQQSPSPASCNTRLSVPAGIPNSIRTETSNGVPQQETRHCTHRNQIPGTRAARQGWTNAHGHDAGTLPPVGSGIISGPAAEGPGEIQNSRIWDETDGGAGGTGFVCREDTHRRRHEEHWNGDEGANASSSIPIRMNTDRAVGPTSGDSNILSPSSSSITSQNMEVEDDNMYYSVYEPSSPGPAVNDQEFESSGDVDMGAMVEDVGDFDGAD